MTNVDDYKRILTRYWGYSSFRPLQLDVIKSVAEGRDTLVLMPTGGGKSITFQVPALAKEGICLVITPLVALMKDQVDRLKKMEIRAMAIHAGMMKEEISISLDNCIYGDYKFLYISPERLRSEVFRNRVQKMNVSLVAVDEAHCISQWGYDFRPSYLKIAELRDLLPEGTPFLGLTATATPNVVDDIMQKLCFREKNVLSTSFIRKNIVYVARKLDNKEAYLLRTLNKIDGQGIIYVRSRKKSREIATFLVQNNITAEFYHAGLSRELREQKQNIWMSGRVRIMVSTNAFGMGIDKEEVRFVIHWDIPDSIESYFQESGRAGRDGKKAWAVQLFSKADIARARDRIRINFPPVDRIKDIYELLCNFLEIPIGGGKDTISDFNIGHFVSKYKLSVSEAYNSIKFLEKNGYLELTEELNNPSRVHFIVTRDDLYKFQVAKATMDSFIKLLLRSYTGMFNGFVAINEDYLSKKSGLDREKIYNIMTQLSSLNIIRYIPGKKSALILLMEERLDRKN
ncbi:MAG: ATP-dependent DNA helicase RecQ [Bacteroidales bacterium]|nr:ATP-dependent DNA helicase RecQ [Bacteroidales bacterium]